MTEPSFGKVFGMQQSDLNSIVSLSACPSSIDAIQQTIGSLIPRSASWDYGSLYPVTYFDDDYGERQFAVLTSGPNLKVYLVDTVALTITLDSTTAFTPTDTVDYYFGMKRSGAGGNFYIYYGHVDAQEPATYYRFRMITVTPGGGYSDSVLQEITFDTSGSKWSLQDQRIVGRTGYAGFVRRFPATGACTSYDIYIYSLDMETNTVAGGLVYSVVAGGWYVNSMAYNSKLVFSEYNGVLNWYSLYIFRQLVTPPYSAYCHAVINGVDTLVHTYYFSSSSEYAVCSPAFQYNRRDYVFFCTWHVPGSGTYSARYVSDGTWVVASAAWGAPNEMHSSLNKFPCINYDFSGSLLYYWVDKDTGVVGSQLVVPGITSIVSIMPTLDTVDDSLYMIAKMPDSSYQVVGVDPDTLALRRSIAVPVNLNYSPGLQFNHGNFIAYMPFNILVVNYLVNFVVPAGFKNVMNMIPEWF